MSAFNDVQLLAYFKDNGLVYESVPAMKDAFRFCHHRVGFLVIQLQPDVGEIDKCEWFSAPVNRSMFGLIYTHHHFGHVVPIARITWQESIARFEIRIREHNVTKFQKAYAIATKNRNTDAASIDANDDSPVDTTPLLAREFRVHVMGSEGSIFDGLIVVPGGGLLEVCELISSKSSVVYRSKKRKREETADDATTHSITK